MLLSDGAEFLPKRRQDPEKDRKDNELKWLLWDMWHLIKRFDDELRKNLSMFCFALI